MDLPLCRLTVPICVHQQWQVLIHNSVYGFLSADLTFILKIISSIATGLVGKVFFCTVMLCNRLNIAIVALQLGTKFI